MNKINIKGANDAAGEYELPDNFTFREMHLIKRITQLRAGEIYPALEAGDTDVVAAFSVVALRRAKPWLDAEKLILDSKIDEIEVVVQEEEAEEERPPADAADETASEDKK